jgi:hypothetical protein
VSDSVATVLLTSEKYQITRLLISSFYLATMLMLGVGGAGQSYPILFKYVKGEA